MCDKNNKIRLNNRLRKQDKEHFFTLKSPNCHAISYTKKRLQVLMTITE